MTNGGPKMARRALFKGAAGAGAAAVARGQPEVQQQSRYHMPPSGACPEELNAAKGLLDGMPDVTHMAKQAMMQRAQEEAKAQEHVITRKRASLQRMKSVSAAYVDYQMEQFQKEQVAVWNRLEEARRFIFG